MKNILPFTKKSATNAYTEEGVWLNGVPALVADNNDPERQHRVRVIIPSIDEDIVFDEWARQMVFCLGNGFGSAFIPPKGSEVVLFGQLGQKFNLFYASLYNEEMTMPEGYTNEMIVGIHAPGNLVFIAEQLAKIQAQNIEAIAEQVAKVLANKIELTADQNVEISGNNILSEASQLSEMKGASVSINADGTISIQGGSVSINGTSVTIRGRTVLPVGPPI